MSTTRTNAPPRPRTPARKSVGSPRVQRAAKPKKRDAWKLRLFVAGRSAKSARAIANLKALCEQHLDNRYQIEVIVVDQIFNSAEKRLARILLLLSRFGSESRTETVATGITQEHLAQMVGTTRSRVNYFMNKFRKLGFITYNGKVGTTVHRGLLTVVRELN